MLIDTFEDVEKEYNAGEESCRVSLEGRLRQDTFEALQVLNAESWRGEDVPEIVQGNAEGYSGESDRVSQKRISPAVEETPQTARQRGLRASQATDVHRSGQYWQKTKITGKDPLDVSGGATHMAQEDGLMDPSRNAAQRSLVSGKVGNSGNVTQTAEENGHVISPRDLGSAQSCNAAAGALGPSNLSDRLEGVRVGLGLRTSTEIFDDLQKEYEEARAQGKTKRRRIRRPNHEQEFETLALGDTRQRMIRGQRMGQSGAGGVNDGERLEQADATGETGRGSIMVWTGLQSDDDGSVNVEDRRDWISETGVTRRGRIRGPKERQTPEGEELAEGRGREELSAVLDSLEEEFQKKERLSESKEWCELIPHHRKVSTVQRFYRAFHDPKTLPIYTCMICYRKFALTELKDADWEAWVATFAELRHVSQFRCRKCFPLSEKVLACGECVKASGKGALSPAGHLHSRLGCEHRFPQELEGLTPVEEKLIALNSCYGFITKYSLSEGQRQRMTYPKHVKGHITVFPNNVEEVATHVLPHPLLKVMDDIHVSWQGAEKPAPKDLSVLLSVRRSVVERALLWLKMNNPLYVRVRIDVDEMDSWGTPLHGVPAQVYDRLRRNEPSVREKTRTAHLVPPTERGLEEGEQVDVREILAGLSEGHDVEMCEAGSAPGGGDGGIGEDGNATVQEVSTSGMFALDGLPDVEDAEKLQYVCDALKSNDPTTARPENVWPGSAEVEHGGASEPYILVSRGETFADSHDVRFFAKTFPTLFPVGDGGPRQAEESLADLARVVDGEASIQAESAACSTVSSRNLGLGTWAREVLQRHGGRFARHHVFSFLVFNMLVRMRNHRVSMMSVRRSSFNEVKRIVDSLGLQRLEVAKRQLMASGKTTDADVMDLLRSLSLYGYRQPMSRELRLSMRRKIKSLIVRHGTPAIWFTLNPNDITNPVKLRLAAYRTRESGEAEEFLTSLDMTYKRARLAISDPLSSALFFHREISMFFKHYVNVGGDSVFGRVSEYFGAVETNERGSLHMHGLLWLHGNLGLCTLFEGVGEEEEQTYRDRVIEYIDSVFTEDLDQEAFCAMKAERSITSDISSLLQNREQFSAAFDEEANFCAGSTQIHTHSPTCVKYSIGRPAMKRDLCRFKAPWKLVERTAFTEDGVLQIRRSHNMVNRWNKAIAVGLRHNHDISFIGTQCRTMAIMYYVTNYATKVEDPIWKRVAAAAEVIDIFRRSQIDNRAQMGCPSENSEQVGQPTESHAQVEQPCENQAQIPRPSTGESMENRTRQLLVKVANRVFTERALSQVEVAAHLSGYPTEFTHTNIWTYLNVSAAYWHVFRRWPYLRSMSGIEDDQSADETVLLEGRGPKISFLQAYPYRGEALCALSLYEYMSVTKLQRKNGGGRVWGQVEFDERWRFSKTWVQVLRRPGKHAVVCFDGYLSVDFEEEEEAWYKRSAEDAKRDARQWAAQSGETDPVADEMDPRMGECEGALGEVFRSDEASSATRLADIFRSAMGRTQITAGSKEVETMLQYLLKFQQAEPWHELSNTSPFHAGEGTLTIYTSSYRGVELPGQEKVKSIKRQQASLSKERERAIQGIQERFHPDGDMHAAAVYNVLTGFGEDDVVVAPADSETVYRAVEPSASVRFGPSTSFCELGRQLSESFTLNRRQSIALRLLCRHLDRLQWSERDIPQHFQYIGGEGGTGKSRVVEAVVKLFASKGISHRLLVTATSGTAAALINGITIHSACNLSMDMSRLGSKRGFEQFTSPGSAGLRVDGQARMEWQEKLMLVIDEISMLGGRTLYAVNERLRALRGITEDFGGIPIVLFCGDVRQFRPVQERSILIPSVASPWDQDMSFRVEQRHQHDKAHALWNRFTAVVILKEHVRAAADPQLQHVLKRIREGICDQNDANLLNNTCYREGERVPWESGITVVTPLNLNRWYLNIEAVLSFQRQHQALLRIFISEHKWKGVQPTEEEALMVLSYGDDSSIPVPAVFMFAAGMPVVVNKNTHLGLKVSNGAAYTAVDVILDRAYPGYSISENIIIHFGPPAAIVLVSESTKHLHFVGMPPGTILITPLSAKLECQRKRPWQRTDVTRRGLPCAAAFACTDYKVQGRTLDTVVVELRGTRTMNVEGRVVPSRCDPYSLYVQLSRCRSLKGIMLLSKAREMDIIGNTVPENMIEAEKRLEELSEATVREAETWDWHNHNSIDI